jgi:IMP cyclohydrolase
LTMYVGRIVAVGRCHGRIWAGYRVSSRSFPSRRAEIRGRSVLVSPKNPEELSKNPYIAYSCLRLWENVAVVANGTQADTILEKVEDGMNPLEATAMTLLAYGYERDELDTPRLAGVVQEDKAWLGIVKRGEIRTKEFTLQEGQALMVATYEKTEFEPAAIAGKSAAEIARACFDLPLERPVCAAAAMASDDGYELAVYNPV